MKQPASAHAAWHVDAVVWCPPQIDMAKPVWSVSWRYTQEVLSA